MPEPVSTSATSAAVATLAATGIAIPVIELFGVPLGLRSDVLVAGFLGSIVGMVLLDTVPGDIDTVRNLVRTTVRRMMVSLASSITAGYLTPLVLLLSNFPSSLLLTCACVVGGGAQQFLIFAIRRLVQPPPKQDQAGTP